VVEAGNHAVVEANQVFPLAPLDGPVPRGMRAAGGDPGAGASPEAGGAGNLGPAD
jgi:hypothetical protein